MTTSEKSQENPIVAEKETTNEKDFELKHIEK